MKRSIWARLSMGAGAFVVSTAGMGSAAQGADPTVDQALKLAPIQKGVNYDVPRRQGRGEVHNQTRKAG